MLFSNCYDTLTYYFDIGDVFDGILESDNCEGALFETRPSNLYIRMTKWMHMSTL